VLAAQLAVAQAGKPLTIESVFAGGGITGREPESIKWSPDGAKVSFVQRTGSGARGALYAVDVASGQKTILVAEDKWATLFPPVPTAMQEGGKEWNRRYPADDYAWAPDSAHLLITSHGQLWLYSLATGTAVQLTSAADPTTDPKFSPDGSRVAYIRKHNLYVRTVNGKGEKALAADKDTNLLNGDVDWVYAEEFYVHSNYFWSPDGSQIVFLQMNEKPVGVYPITNWSPTYPKVEEQKYPKTGSPNPEVRIGVVSADGGKAKWIKVGDPAPRAYEYIPRFGWVRPGILYIELLNRAQNQLELWFADTTTGRAHKMLTESEPDAWVPVEQTPGIWLLPSGSGFLWLSWHDGHSHLYLYRFDQADPLSAEAKLERQITKGSFEVESVDALDERTNLLFFTANAEDARQRQIYSAKLDGSAPVTKISHATGTHRALFAPGGSYYVDTFSAGMVPPRLSLCKVSGACSALWEARELSDYNLLAPKILQLKAADGETTLYGTLLLPAQVKGEARIPLINNPYGGPGEQTVVDSWGGSLFLFDQILAQHGFAVLHVDNRGTAGRGRAFAAAINHRLGEVELADQLAAIEQVLAAYPQLNRDRLGWWGWSYGAYLTLYAMTHSDVFKAGVAVAPVTDWLNYDSIYTERYLGLPNDNPQGYKNSSPLNSAGETKGHVLEIHGTSDDNVHLQNTMQMIKKWEDQGVDFDLQLYPGQSHSISGTAARLHLFHRILDHFDRWLMGSAVRGTPVKKLESMESRNDDGAR
jgi:dipeptidyl-peptidase-4